MMPAGSWLHAVSKPGLTACIALLAASTVQAESPNQFGGQDRANAASELIVIGVQRAMDALPVVSGQSVTYEFDPATDALQRGTRLGPTVLRTAQTVGPGVFSVQIGASYFEQSETFHPINYLVTLNDSPPQSGVAKFALTAKAKVGLFNLSATYGIGSRFEVSAALPITIVDAHASQTFSTDANKLSVPAGSAVVSGAPVVNGDVSAAINLLNAELKPGGPLALRRDSFRSLGFDFNEGTQAGVGRIGVGGKAVVWSNPRLQVAVVPEFFFPSPSQDAYSGPDSAAILPQMVATVKLTDAIHVHTDAGYDYDFDTAALRRFTWTSGVSLGFERAAADLGFSGSEFDAPVRWTPSTMRGEPNGSFPGSTGVALGDNTTGTSLVNVLLGGKIYLNDSMVIAGGVSIPIVNPGFQPDALGTFAVERRF